MDGKGDWPSVLATMEAAVERHNRNNPRRQIVRAPTMSASGGPHQAGFRFGQIEMLFGIADNSEVLMAIWSTGATEPTRLMYKTGFEDEQADRLVADFVGPDHGLDLEAVARGLRSLPGRRDRE